MKESEPVQCQKCGKPVGNITLQVLSIVGLEQATSGDSTIGFLQNSPFCRKKLNFNPKPKPIM